MDCSFNPPRHRFNTVSFDTNLEQQHEELKRLASAFIHHTKPKELEAIIEKTEAIE
jgi:hypothetical protein